MHTVFVTGTDTGVGKTLVSAALVTYWAKQGFKSIGFKPVAAGAEWKNAMLQNEDAEALMAASNVALDYAQVNPYVFELATAPHIAADKAGSAIDVSILDAAYKYIHPLCEKLVVEGAGGWQVPFNDTTSFADWVSQNQWPVILVVDIKLGCLNHARLTCLDILRSGNRLAGWIANVRSENVDYSDEMVQSLATFIDAPLLGNVPPLPTPNAESLLPYLDFSLLEIT
ncbi:MAG: dethiobiotin synthase [Gammaproteobacteria bacterium]|nr:dethiobiotin synthase [Gammaproteobacteria bacterium]